MLCKNTSSDIATIRLDTQPGRPPITLTAKPGESIEIPDGYCVEVPARGGRKLKPIIQRLYEHMVPQRGQYAPGYSAGTYGHMDRSNDNPNDQIAALREELVARMDKVTGEANAAVESALERARAAEAEVEALRRALAAKNAQEAGANPFMTDEGDADALIRGFKAKEVPLADGDEDDGEDEPPRDVEAAEMGETVSGVGPGSPRRELVAEAKRLGVKARSQLNKAQLWAAILEARQ